MCATMTAAADLPQTGALVAEARAMQELGGKARSSHRRVPPMPTATTSSAMEVDSSVLVVAVEVADHQ